MGSGERILLRLCFYLVWGKMLLTTVSITFCICCDVGCAKITCIVYSVLLYANSRCACSRCLNFAFFIFIPYLHNKSYCHFYGSCYETKGGGFRTQLGLVRNMSFFFVLVSGEVTKPEMLKCHFQPFCQAGSALCTYCGQDNSTPLPPHVTVSHLLSRERQLKSTFSVTSAADCWHRHNCHIDSSTCHTARVNKMLAQEFLHPESNQMLI